MPFDMQWAPGWEASGNKKVLAAIKEKFVGVSISTLQQVAIALLTQHDGRFTAQSRHRIWPIGYGRLIADKPGITKQTRSKDPYQFTAGFDECA